MIQEYLAPPAAEPLLVARSLTVVRGGVTVLEDTSLALHAGRVTAILGANGAGKSTLLLAIGGLLRPLRGTVLLAGMHIERLRAEHLVRRGVVHIPQGRHIVPELTVRDNLRLLWFARRHGVEPATPQEALNVFPALQDRLDTAAGLLSGGQQQLLAVARALGCRPRVLLADEPTAALAPAARAAVMDELRRLADSGAAVAVVEQEVDAALRVADTVVVLRAGRVVEVRDA